MSERAGAAAWTGINSSASSARPPQASSVAGRPADWAGTARPNPLGHILALRDRSLLERRAQAFGELHGVVVGPEVNEEHSGLLREHVIVDRRHLHALPPPRPDPRGDPLRRH